MNAWSLRSAVARVVAVRRMGMAAALLLGACTAKPGAAPAPGPSYSPFVLQMSGGELPFGQISFKDVGMSVEPSERGHVYEALASSLASELASHPAAPMSSEVVYSEAAADPSSHLACGVAHIYVDVWAPQGTERWGYSLWSGCSEEDRFAHREVPRSTAMDVSSLSRDIADTLRSAIERRCFVASC